MKVIEMIKKVIYEFDCESEGVYNEKMWSLKLEKSHKHNKICCLYFK